MSYTVETLYIRKCFKELLDNLDLFSKDEIIDEVKDLQAKILSTETFTPNAFEKKYLVREG